jgi:hypothetical protein
MHKSNLDTIMEEPSAADLDMEFRTPSKMGIPKKKKSGNTVMNKGPNEILEEFNAQEEELNDSQILRQAKNRL